MTSTSVAGALAQALAQGLSRLDAQLLLGAALQRPRSWLLAHDDHVLNPSEINRFHIFVERRAEDEPVAYLLGEKEFHGLRLSVNPDVLVPRPETETLVEWALDVLNRGPAQPTVLDLGTGSGAVALALAKACPQAHVCAADISPQALIVARANGQRLGLNVEWLQSNWWAALVQRRFDLVVCNPPYIATTDTHLAALRHEPRVALVAGSDGLGAIRLLVDSAPEHLTSGGWLLLEHGYTQAETVEALLLQSGFVEVSSRQDLAGQPRSAGGRTPTAS